VFISSLPDPMATKCEMPEKAIKKARDRGSVHYDATLAGKLKNG